MLSPVTLSDKTATTSYMHRGAQDCQPSCHVMATCDNYQCVCNEGYQGDGVTLCEKIPVCICRLRGDPLLETFDGQWLMVMGEKKYTMVKHMDPLDVCSFNVEVKTQPSSSNPDKTYPNFMDVEVYNLKIRVSNSLVVTIGGQEITLPANNTHHPGLAIYMSDGYVVIKTDCGLRVAFNGKSRETAATLTIPPRYAKKITGMCGDCNSLQDDLRLKNGTDVASHPDVYALISNSYAVDESDSQFLPSGSI